MKARDIARKFKAIRKAKGLTQEHVASRIGISVSQISRIEAGQRGLAIDRLGPWSRSLGYRAEIVLWEDERGEPELDILDGPLDSGSVVALNELAGALPQLSDEARASIVQLLGLWRSELSQTLDGTEQDD